MYLVHARLAMPADADMPPDVREAVRRALRPEDRVEHLAVHPRAPWLTLGFFVLADALGEAEAHAERVCRRLLSAVPQLGAARLVGVGVPLISEAFAPSSLRD
ncbi:hypothetical protein [Streptomyces galbus]|uniref:Uncharacterized protein n=1 Tax=Streptomyces galbus TaxID=33898 RepID=A0A4U5X8L3_STRGB|nr:hypothetical protein [Streptomyces galbus]TKT11524.1 hypothetical protein E4U92_01195 [Streptomyces galbus]GHD30726.1 hypothetical protein GCM10010335_21080 [Streptomyces galbus]